MSLFLFTVNSPEVNVGVQSLDVAARGGHGGTHGVGCTGNGDSTLTLAHAACGPPVFPS